MAHAATGQTSEIVSGDPVNNALWVVGLVGIDVLNASTGAFVDPIDTRAWGSANSVAVHNGLAAVAIENGSNRSQPGTIKLFDTTTRQLAAGTNSITAGSLPDMVTFSKDGLKPLRSTNVKGLYQPDGIALYERNGQTDMVMANEGDTLESETDKKRLSGVAALKNNAPADVQRLNISVPDSSVGNLVTFGARLFSIRDEDGNLVFDSGSQLDDEAIECGDRQRGVGHDDGLRHRLARAGARDLRPGAVRPGRAGWRAPSPASSLIRPDPASEAVAHRGGPHRRREAE